MQGWYKCSNGLPITKSKETAVDGLTKGIFKKTKAVYVKRCHKISTKHETKLKQFNNANKTQELSGVDMEGKQVLINEHWQSTTHPHMYAIGDVDKGSMLAHQTHKEGVARIENLTGQAGHSNYNAMPEVTTVGSTEQASGIEYREGEYPFVTNSCKNKYRHKINSKNRRWVHHKCCYKYSKSI